VQSEGPEPSNEEAPTLRKTPVAQSTGRINVFLLLCPPTGDGHGCTPADPAQGEGPRRMRVRKARRGLVYEMPRAWPRNTRRINGYPAY
jgi:hypothetical protein